MAGFLSQPTMSDLEFVDIATGNAQVDIDWTGAANHVDLAQIRTRWIARTNGASAPAPNQNTAEGWAESAVLRTEGDFRYIDTIEIATGAQMGVANQTYSEENEMVTQGFFANKTLWALSRLEV